MKRMINSTTKQWYVDSVDFCWKLETGLEQFTPKRCMCHIDPSYSQLSLYECPSEDVLVSATQKAVEVALGWEYIKLNRRREGYDAAAVAPDDRFVYLSYFYREWDKTGFISITYSNSCARYNSWY